LAETKTVAVETNSEDNRLDKKVTVKSIAPWVTGSSRKTTSGDVSIPPNGTVLLSREEIIAQAQNGNTLLTGIDGVGSHATWYVEDDFVRKELSFDIGDKKQEFLSQDVVKKLFEIKTMKSFENNIKEKVITRAEKAALLSYIKSLKLNDYEKISFCVNYTGMKM
jgi:hypothetical protein